MEQNGTIKVYYLSLFCGLTRQIWLEVTPSSSLTAKDGLTYMSGVSAGIAETSLQEVWSSSGLAWACLDGNRRVPSSKGGSYQWAENFKTSAGITFTVVPLAKPRVTVSRNQQGYCSREQNHGSHFANSLPLVSCLYLFDGGLES